MDVFDRLQSRQIGELRTSLRKLRAQAESSGELDRVHLDRLEDYLGRTLLLLQAVTEACLRKEVFTADELNALAAEIDASDGIVDGRLDPGVLLGSQSASAEA